VRPTGGYTVAYPVLKFLHLPEAGTEEDWRREVDFWKSAGVTHVTARSTFNSGHHKRIQGRTSPMSATGMS
jgi:hypothetical protein